jgi:hypothetical protein
MEESFLPKNCVIVKVVDVEGCVLHFEMIYDLQEVDLFNELDSLGVLQAL